MSLHSRKGSSFLQATVAVPAPSGEVRRLELSTGTDDPGVADKIQRAASTIDTLGRKPSAARVRSFCEAILEAAGHPSPWQAGAERGFSEFAADYSKRRGDKLGALAPAVFRDFAKFAGFPALSACTPELLQGFCDRLVEQDLSSGHVANQLACLSGLFRHGVKLGVLPSNPVASVEQGDYAAVIDREAFPDDVFAKFLGYLLQCGEWDAHSWFAACMLGRYAGMSIIDAVNFPASGVRELDGRRFIAYARQKTGAEVLQPVFSPLKEWLDIQRYDVPHLCPGLAGRKSNVLSARFGDLLERAGCAGEVVVAPSGRNMRVRTFHSFRAAYVTWLSKLGIPEDLRMKISGHSQKGVHRGYDKTDAAGLALLLDPYFTKNL